MTGACAESAAAAGRPLAGDGARVAVDWREGEATARAAVDAIRGAGEDAEAFAGDGGDPAEAVRLVERFAGAGSRRWSTPRAPQLLDDVGAGPLHRRFAVDIRGLVMASQATVRRFPEGGGAFFDISSANGRRLLPGRPVCSAAEAAVDAPMVA